MSVTVIKSLSIKRAGDGYDITYSSASSNVTPRWYSPYTEHVQAAEYDNWMNEFATSLFNGCARFLPSARCRANQAYQIALHKMGGDWSYAWNKYGNDTPEYKEFRAQFVSAFLDAMQSGYDGGHPLPLRPMAQRKRHATRDGTAPREQLCTLHALIHGWTTRHARLYGGTPNRTCPTGTAARYRIEQRVTRPDKADTPRQAYTRNTQTTKIEQQQARRCRGALLHDNNTPHGTYNSMRTARERNADGQATRCSTRNTRMRTGIDMCRFHVHRHSRMYISLLHL